MKFYISIFAVILIVFLTILGTIYYIYKKEKDKERAFFSMVFLCILVGVSVFSKYLLIYKPLLIFHIILLIFGWIELFRYLFTKKANFYFLFSPVLTVILFFLIGLIFAN